MENKEQFLEKFRLLFDTVEPEAIQLNTNFKDIDEWGSLTVLSLIVMCEEECKVNLTPDQIEKAATIEDLYQLVKS